MPVGDTNDTTTAKTQQNKINLLAAAGALDEYAFTLNRPARARRRTEGVCPDLAEHLVVQKEH